MTASGNCFGKACRDGHGHCRWVSMDHRTPRLPSLALAALIAAGLLTGCERRPRDPKPPSDPGRNVPKPVTAVVLPVLTANAVR